MFDKTTLSQLSTLKQAIHESKEYGNGTIASTSGRFGFVRLSDGRDAFLSPEKMQFVLPTDEVKVLLTTNDKGKIEATIEKITATTLTRFIGTYRVKGNAHFAVPDDSNINRWIFVPPKMRKGAQEGDKIVAKITQHPEKDGKAQAKIIERIGQEDISHFEYKYTAAKHGLTPWNKEGENEQVGTIADTFKKADFGERVDFTHIPFVTIDAQSTRDMDDAVAIERLDGKIQLRVAIADPATFIDAHSPVAKLAQRQAQTTYMLGGVIPMLPEQLAHDCFSLIANENRPALVCTIVLNDAGAVQFSGFEMGLIRSRHKLSYQQVSEFLEGDSNDAVPSDTCDDLTALYDFAQTRSELRRSENLTTIDHLDYDIRLDDKGKIQEMRPRTRTKAHKIIEEAMLLTNICAGKLLAEHNLGLHSVHSGFRTDRIGEVNALLKEEEVTQEADINSLNGHLELFNTLFNNERLKPLIPALKRMTTPSQLMTEPGPHMGMGFTHYATVTSPIRRYADLYNHWALISIIKGGKPYTLNDNQVTRLKEKIDAGRQADRELYLWLVCQHIKTSLIGFEGRGKIRIVTQQGFGVRLIENGIDGFVAYDKSQEKQFDAKRMTLTVNDTVYRIDDEVDVKVDSVDMKKRRIAFKLTD